MCCFKELMEKLNEQKKAIENQNEEWVLQVVVDKNVLIEKFKKLEAEIETQLQLLSPKDIEDLAQEGKVLKENIETVVGIGTDKAVSPLNTYGATKLLMEKLLTTAQNYLDIDKYRTKFLAVRYGNVLGSSGSVLPKFVSQIKKKQKITITDPNMTRFSLTMDEALDFILKSTSIGKGTEVFVPKLKAYSINGLKESLFELLENTGEKIISLRPGEKMHETLLNSDELRYVWELDDKYVLFNSAKQEDEIENSYPKIKKLEISNAYSSNTVEKLTKDELNKIILKSKLLD